MRTSGWVAWLSVPLLLGACSHEDIQDLSTMLTILNAGLEEANGVVYEEWSDIDDEPMGYGYMRYWQGVRDNQYYIRVQNRTSRVCEVYFYSDLVDNHTVTLYPGQVSETYRRHASVPGGVETTCDSDPAWR